jgi:hypothetical protein
MGQPLFLAQRPRKPHFSDARAKILRKLLFSMELGEILRVRGQISAQIGAGFTNLYVLKLCA